MGTCGGRAAGAGQGGPRGLQTEGKPWRRSPYDPCAAWPLARRWVLRTPPYRSGSVPPAWGRPGAWRGISAECKTNQRHVNLTLMSKPISPPCEMPGGTSASLGTRNCGLECRHSAETRAGLSTPVLRANLQAKQRPCPPTTVRADALGPMRDQVTHGHPVTRT